MTTTDLPSLPNVILIVTDQMRADHLGCYGQSRIRTPNIDALAAHGTRFDRCYVASPTCMPNRASIMTGRLPTAHRVRMNGIPLSIQENTFVELLRLRGYGTALIGKSHLQNVYDTPPQVQPPPPAPGVWVAPQGAREAVRHAQAEDYGQELPSHWAPGGPRKVRTPFYGFEHVRLCMGHGEIGGGDYADWLRARGWDPETSFGPEHCLPHDYTCPQAWRTSLPEALYPTRYVESESISFLESHVRQRTGRPFFLTASFPDPHHPFTPPGRYWDMYKPEDQVLPTSFHSDDSALPQVRWARETRRRGGPPGQTYGAFSVTEKEAREAIALTFGMISMIDDSIGRLMAYLERAGLSDNTIVIFTSDHGDYLGDHSLMLKGSLHLQSVLRVPLIWFDPRTPKPGPQARADLCSSIDISATILERCRIHPYNGMQGRSLVPAMEGAPPRVEPVLIEEDAQGPHLGFDQAPRIRTLMTERHRLSIYGRSGHAELFDLREDPHELRNRWDDPEFTQLRSQLVEQLAMAEMDASDSSPWPVFAA